MEPEQKKETQRLSDPPLSQTRNRKIICEHHIRQQGTTGPSNSDQRTGTETTMSLKERSPSDTLKLLKELPGQTPLILDLDETLVLQSTTDGFLGSVWPKEFAMILLFLLDRIHPWRFTGGDEMRDWFRVLVVAIVMPWSLFRWHLLARSWTFRWANNTLVEVVRSHEGPVTVATRGFDPIVKPVLAALCLNRAELVANRIDRPGDRLQTKTEILRRSGSAYSLKEAVVVTDSEDDHDLLINAGIGCLTRWSDEEWSNPFNDVYLPFLYTERVKNPSVRFVLDAWIADDFVAILLAFTWTASQPVIHGLGLAALMIAFWTTYEIGYHENDVLGSTYEAKPKLSKAFIRSKYRMPKFAPWVWASALTIVGACLLTVPTETLHPLSTTIIIWLLILVVTRATFAIFNRLPKTFRIFPHAVLQLEKFGSLALLTAITPIGIITIASQSLYRWVPYVKYRLGSGKSFPEVHTTTFRLAVILAGLMVLAFFNAEIAVSWHAAVVLGWFTLRSRRSLTILICRVVRLISVRRQ
ncbi:MAG: haloacid dehalogenase-like hydrolase [Candidatus Scalindua sp. AMX11]|nr:MAG: haloacid dehalogenase-like hydrolase [Candidatus Scalindua sp.]NOG82987.1 haloacid dehalogenase-like hydrolase [Planctomycetota bacterium]RZV68039.1 MAG: haloacid dehalogenase-like hydrolase [Candidatus Scalindua sp. SCAELEC01]TDE63730.1 MAG: haloacid dehalogenase-like hydrolase [Candidatus Scalindua sp. AMX11]